jgi:flagellar FliL protein
MTAKKKTATEETEEAGGGKKKLIMMVVALLVVGGGGYFMFLKPASAEPPAPEPGEVVTIEPIQINLAAGHYLKLGLGLQLTTAASHGADGAKALDAAIELFSGRSMNELTNAEKRAKLKKTLMKELEHDYHGDVMDVYFTDFVTQ